MTETHHINPILLMANPLEYIRVSVPTGNIKTIRRDEVTGMFGGIHFPGVIACIPLVLWSIESQFTLAIHSALGHNNPDQLANAIMAHKDKYGRNLGWSIHAAEVISDDYPEIASLPKRVVNLHYIASLAKVEKIHTKDSALNLSFHPAIGFRIVK